MRVLTLLSVVIACASASSLLGNKACTWGPSYWCSHVKHARECGATKHCMQTVWKHQILPKSSVKTCTYCQLIVSGLKDMLAQKQTEIDIGQVLSEMCALLPNPDWKDQCSGIVTEYTPEIIQMLDNDISTDMVCATIGLCAGLEDTYSPYGQQDSPVSNATTECQDCTKFMGDIQASLTSKETENQLEQLFNQTICSQFGALAGECSDVVKQYLPLMLQYLADQFDPNQVCLVFGFCTTKDKDVPTLDLSPEIFKSITTRPLKYRSSEECDICKDLLTQLDDLIRNKGTQDKIKDFLENTVCAEFGGFAANCKQLVEEYAPLVFEFLENTLDPTTFCEMVGICVTPSLKSLIMMAGPIIPAVKLVPALQVQPGLETSVECTVCKLVLENIDDLLKENSTVVTIEDLIFKICNKLSSPDLNKQCHAFVQEYGQMILDELANVLDPSMICSKIGACAASLKTAPVKVNAEPAQKAGPFCGLCQMAIKALETALKNVSTDVIIADLESVCKFLPGNYSQLCLQYVTQYGPLVINLLKSGEDPASLCALGKLCSTPPNNHIVMTVPIPEEQSVKASASVECQVCDTALLALKEYVGNNATEADIKKAFESLCQKLPEFASACQDLVDEYGQTIIDDLIKGLKPHEICVDLTLCDQVSVKMPKLQEFLSPVDTLPLQGEASQSVKASASFECEVCDTALLALKEYVGNNATEADIKKAFESLCQKLPEFASVCQDLVDEYGQRIIDDLIKGFKPHEICVDLTLCAQVSVKIPNLQEFLSPVDTLPLQGEASQSAPSAAVTDMCGDCKFVVQEIIRIVGQNATQMEIRTGLDTVCGFLPDAVSGFCQDLVNQYTQELINLLILNLDPSVICQKLECCPVSKTKPLPHPVHVKLLKDNKGADASVECVVCEFGVKELISLLDGNTSRAAIEAALDKVCSLLPDTISTECKTFVNTYGPQLIELLISGASPDKICTDLKLCTAENVGKFGTLVHLLKGRPLDAGVECVMCEFGVKELIRVLDGNKSEAAIQAALDKVCSLLPDTISTECQTFVDEYGPQLIKLLISGVSPSKICTDLKLCTAENVSKFGTLVHLLKGRPLGLSKCAVCEEIIIAIRAAVKQNATEEELELLLKTLCDEFPDTVTVQCEAKAKETLKKVLAWLKQELKPEDVCKNLKYCPDPKQQDQEDTKLYFRPHKPLIGSKKCTYGPSYWCASMENAQECNAVPHCKKHVWKK